MPVERAHLAHFYRPLTIACLSDRDVVIAILHSDQWRDAMDNVTQSARHARVTPIRLLIKKYPDLAEEVFNMCTKTNGLEVRLEGRGGRSGMEAGGVAEGWPVGGVCGRGCV